METLIDLLLLINVQVLFTINPVKPGQYSTNKVIIIDKSCLFKHVVLQHEFVHALQHYVWEFDLLPLPDFVAQQHQVVYAETVLLQAYTKSINRLDIDQHNEFQAICCELATVEELVTLFYKHIKQ